MMLRKLGMLGHIAHMLYIAINIDLGSWANLRRKGRGSPHLHVSLAYPLWWYDLHSLVGIVTVNGRSSGESESESESES